jgi:hypothetical protein
MNWNSLRKSYILSLVLIFSIGILVNPQYFNGAMTYAQNVNTIRVPGTAGDSSNPSSWVDSGIVLTGNTVSVSSSGIAYYCPGCTSSPDGPPQGSPDAGKPPGLCPSCNLARVPVGALVAKVGDSNPVLVGSGPTTLAGNGRIYFSFNDGYGDHSNNSGEYLVTVSGASPARPFDEVREINKVAIIFKEIHVWESETAIGCSNWEVSAWLYGQGEQKIQRLLQKCVDQDNTYPLDTSPAIVEDYFGERRLDVGGDIDEWGADFRGGGELGHIDFTLSEPPRTVSTWGMNTLQHKELFGHSFEVPIFSISFDVINCRSGYSYPPGSPCGYPPGIYYRLPGSQVWINGVAPSTDLEGCSFFC